MKSDHWLPAIAFSFLSCIVSRFHSYLNSTSEILKQYKGEEPFSSFLKKFFSLNKKYGSRDRKEIAQLCYCYYRLGKDFTDLGPFERILTGLLLSSSGPNEIIAALKPEWSEKISLPLFDKLSCLSPVHSTLSVFPWTNRLSEGIDFNLFNQSFLVQPDLFLRVRPGYENIVLEKIRNSGYRELVGSLPNRQMGPETEAFPSEPQVLDQRWVRLIRESCIELPNGTKIEELIDLDKEAVIQDYSSQRIAEFVEMVRPGRSDHFNVWDCCAGSGGKSILAKDVLGDMDLTVSDIRESILSNLKKRFQKAGISNYKSMVKDLTAPASRLPPPAYDLILCDAPCTGSGTWSRTPEQLYFFDEKKIGEYSLLQKKIVAHVIPELKPGGYFLYITCSVFRKENEEIVEFIRAQFQLTLVKMELLKGYDKKADSMFAALFIASGS